MATAKTVTSPINIDEYTEPFSEYPQTLIDFAEQNNIVLPRIGTMRGQALALMAQDGVRGKRYISRTDAEKFFDHIGMETGDAIQQFNKATGLSRMNMRGKYCLQYPFVCDTTDIDKRKGATISGDRNQFIHSIKGWFQKNIIDIPNKEWQMGHLDPTISDASEKNLAWQPPIQGKYRDRFKFDKYFLKMWPTASELVPKFDDYYTEKEQMAIYEALKQKFEK